MGYQYEDENQAVCFLVVFLNEDDAKKVTTVLHHIQMSWSQKAWRTSNLEEKTHHEDLRDTHDDSSGVIDMVQTSVMLQHEKKTLHLYSRGLLDEDGYHNSSGNGLWKVTLGSLIVERGKKESKLYMTHPKISKSIVNAVDNDDMTEL
ncbi:hypothetical protein Tco_0014682 [Tanacetum coccineum]